MADLIGDGGSESSPAPAFMSDAEIGAAPTIVLALPCPPSANTIWRKVPGVKRPMLSEEYREWIKTAGWVARMQLVGIPTITGAFTALITVPQKSRRDRDNWSKPLFDLCQRVGAVRNDSGLRDYSVTAGDREDCMIALWDAGGPPMSEPRARRTPGHGRTKKASAAQIAAVSAVLRRNGR